MFSCQNRKHYLRFFKPKNRRYQGEYDPERLVKRLQAIHPMTMVRDEKSLSGTVSYKYMMLILRTYNGSSRRFNLPIKQ